MLPILDIWCVHCPYITWEAPSRVTRIHRTVLPLHNVIGQFLDACISRTYIFVPARLVKKIQFSWVSNSKFPPKYSPVAIHSIPQKAMVFWWKLPFFVATTGEFWLHGNATVQCTHCALLTEPPKFDKSAKTFMLNVELATSIVSSNTRFIPV